MKLNLALRGITTTYFPMSSQNCNALLPVSGQIRRLSITHPCLILFLQKLFDEYRFSLTSPRSDAFLPHLLRVEPLAKVCQRTKENGAETYTLPEMMPRCQEIAGTGNHCAYLIFPFHKMFRICRKIHFIPLTALFNQVVS